MNIFVGNLTATVTAEELRRLFAGFGSVVNARIMKDTANDKSLGYGHVFVVPEEAAREAITALHQAPLKGRLIRLRECRFRAREERRQSRMRWDDADRRRSARRLNGHTMGGIPPDLVRSVTRPAAPPSSTNR
jgi:RNA recognition motif-containing protein